MAFPKSSPFYILMKVFQMIFGSSLKSKSREKNAIQMFWQFSINTKSIGLDCLDLIVPFHFNVFKFMKQWALAFP